LRSSPWDNWETII